MLTIQTVTTYVDLGMIGADSHAYWATGGSGSLYEAEPRQVDAYLYSPIFAQLIQPATALPWSAFRLGWMAAEIAVFLWLLRPIGWRWAIPLTLCCAAEWAIGNIVPFMAAAAVLGMRRPGWWTLVLLTKPTMALGPVWFAVRGEWASLRRFGIVAGAAIAVSSALAPSAWREWVSFLSVSADQTASAWLLLRTLGAVVLTAFAARYGRPWLLPFAMLLATPVFAGASSFTVLAAIPRLARTADARSRSCDEVAQPS